MDSDDVYAGSGPAIDNLYPALTQCFAVILCGYLAGRMNLISETEAKGFNTFVGTFSLPSVIFMSLAKLELGSVNWWFLLSILVSKGVVFFSVIIVTLLVVRPVNFGRSGIFAIFCTQSNDFAIGYPLVEALYKTSHPEYLAYIYLVAPVNLIILNPVAFFLMEIHKRQRDSSFEPIMGYTELSDSVTMHKERCKMLMVVAKNIFTNPIVFMTILGIVGNLAFHHVVPVYLAGILEVLASAFSASALFLLGLKMVGKVQTLRGATLVVPGILIMVKLIALPLVTREVVSVLRPGHNESDTEDLSTYGFLYGTFPSAPGVFVFASQYLIDADLIASSMVACTFLSAPLMFVSAKMITLSKANPSDYIKQLDMFTFDISIVGSIACVWVLVIFLLTKKLNRVPHKITACLIASQLISCLGAILWNTINSKEGLPGYLQFLLFIAGVYSARMWTTILSITLVFLKCRSLCFVLKLQPFFVLAGWGIPVLLSIVLLLFDMKGTIPFNDKNPNFVYGLAQAIVSVSLLLLCFIVTAGCLILHQRYHRHFLNYSQNNDDTSENNESPRHVEAETSTNLINNVSSTSNGDCRHTGCLPTITEGYTEESPVVDIEDLFSNKNIKTMTPAIADESPADNLCPSAFGCHGRVRNHCQGIVQQYQQQIDEDMELIEEEPEAHEPQILRHTVLLILLLCSMFVGLALSIWTLMIEENKMTGIYVELSFLDATLNFGQSIIVFAIFGLNTDIVLPFFMKYFRKLFYGENTLNLPAWHELSPETKHICDQFVTHHLSSCQAAIATDKRWRIKVYKDVFSGHKFVDWLIEVGLARDRVEAVNYARHLVEGKVLKHINNVYHFYDRNLLYTFG